MNNVDKFPVIRFNAGLQMLGYILITIVTALLSIACHSTTFADPQSGAGFRTLTLFLVIETILLAFRVQFEDHPVDRSTANYLGTGLNRFTAAIVLILTAVPHPALTGVLLWLGISVILLRSGAMHLLHVGFVAWRGIQSHWDTWTAVRHREKAEQEMAAALKAQEIKAQQEAKIEEDLISDLNNFLSDKK